MIIWSGIIPGKQVSTNHAYPRNKQGRRFLSTEGKDYKKMIGDLAKYTFPREISLEPLVVEIEYTFGDKRRRDINNYDKLIVDALEGVVYEDDKQIVELILRKKVSNKFETKIMVYEKKQEEV